MDLAYLMFSAQLFEFSPWQLNKGKNGTPQIILSYSKHNFVKTASLFIISNSEECLDEKYGLKSVQHNQHGKPTVRSKVELTNQFFRGIWNICDNAGCHVLETIPARYVLTTLSCIFRKTNEAYIFLIPEIRQLKIFNTEQSFRGLCTCSSSSRWNSSYSSG